MPATITVHVQPRARRNQIEGFVSGVLRARVTAPPEDGRANQALVALLAEALGVPQAWVHLRHGLASRRKLVEVQGLEPEEVRRRLTAGSRER